MPNQLRGIEELPVAYYFQNVNTTILKLEYLFSTLIKQSLLQPVQLSWLLTIDWKVWFGADLQIEKN